MSTWQSGGLDVSFRPPERGSSAWLGCLLLLLVFVGGAVTGFVVAVIVL